MMKYVLLIAFLGIVYWVWRKRHARPPVAGEAKLTPDERMVRCAHCGVHLPESESVEAGGEHFCTPAHRDAASDKRS